MASTVTAADLLVTITESYTLNNVSYGNTTTKTFSSNGQVDQRIMNVATSSTTLFMFDTADSAGTAVAADYVYFRVTNLDDTNFVTLRLFNGADSFWLKIAAGESLLLMNNEMDAVTGSTFGALADISHIYGQSNTAACDVEFMCVTT
tara:strand:- start:1431 stop:1874 length:444 start_codon:yes stop_codon:yes gene_type:complete